MESEKLLTPQEAADYLGVHYNSYADMSEFTQQSLEYAKVIKGDLNDTARYELMKLYQRYANQNFISFDDYVELLQNWE